MWASQTWMNVHPAVGPSVPYGRRSPQFTRFDAATFDAMTDHIVRAYFSQPNYRWVQLKPGGPRCLFFSIYEPSTVRAVPPRSSALRVFTQWVPSARRSVMGGQGA